MIPCHQIRTEINNTETLQGNYRLKIACWFKQTQKSHVISKYRRKISSVSWKSDKQISEHAS